MLLATNALFMNVRKDDEVASGVMPGALRNY